MKQAKFFLVILLVTIIPLMAHAAEKQKTEGLDLSQQKAQYEKNMEERLNKVGKQLEDLKLKASSASKQARTEVGSYLAQAEKKNKMAIEKLKKMREKSIKEWKKLSIEMDHVAADLEKEYEKAKSHFKE